MNVIKMSLERCEAVVSSAYGEAVRLKDAGMLSGQMTPIGSGSFGPWQDQSRNIRRYSLYEGWLYSAVNVQAQEAASQPVSVGRLSKPPPASGERARPSAAKSYLMSKMTPAACVKSVHKELEILEDHRLVRTLDRPNSVQERNDFVYTFVANINLTGRAYVICNEGEGGELEFWSLPTTWVNPIHDPTPFCKFEVRNPDNPSATGEVFDRTQVGFAQLPDPANPLKALAPAAAQMRAIRIDDHIQTSQERFFNNGIFPSVIITVGKDAAGNRPKLSPAQRRQLFSAVTRRHQGTERFGMPAVVDGWVESIERLSATQVEMGWEKSEDKVRTRILSAFAVHPYVLGEHVSIGGHAQTASIEKRFCKRVNVFLDMLGGVMTNLACTAEQDDGLVIWWEPCEARDQQLYNRLLMEARKNEDVTRNELRTELGYPPVEEKAERARLLETVGGMTGAVQMLTAAGQGLIPRDALAQWIVEFFQVDEDRAKELAGEASEEETVGEAVEALRAAVAVLGVKPESIAYQVAETVK